MRQANSSRVNFVLMPFALLCLGVYSTEVIGNQWRCFRRGRPSRVSRAGCAARARRAMARGAQISSGITLYSSKRAGRGGSPQPSAGGSWLPTCAQQFKTLFMICPHTALIAHAHLVSQGQGYVTISANVGFMITALKRAVAGN